MASDSIRLMGEAFRTEAISVTVPADVLAAARELVAAGKAPSLSALVSETLAARVAREGDAEHARAHMVEHFLGGEDFTEAELARGQEMLAAVRARAAARRSASAA
jgi:Arc/MetJ-type ribon-helix-helix transcriptional regulator